MHKLAKLALIFFLASVIVVPTNFANAEAPVTPITQEHVQDEVIVGYFDNGTAAENEAVRGNSYKAVNAITNERISPRVTNTEVLKIGKGVSVEAAIARLKNQPGIRFVEPNYIVHSMAISNDPYFTNSSLWGMYGASTSPINQFGSNAADAWTRGDVGSSNVVIGVIDEGIQINHPDLAANIWINPGEIGGISGVDDDKNGYIDDINGWDFANNNASVYDGGTSGTRDKHGTHVSGTIGGKGGDAFGVAGVNWNVTIISTKFLGTNGGSTSNAVRALDYLTNLKSRALNPVNLIATNNSWGGGGNSAALLDAINRSGDAGMLFVAAAGNSTANNDVTESYPSNYLCTKGLRTSDCVIAVAAINSAGALAGFSSYGANSVDLGAPGVGIFSTVPYGIHESYNGTSMATPHVTGAVALCKSINPLSTANQIRTAILESTALTESLTAKTATRGRLDIGAMALKCKNFANEGLLQNQTAPLLITNTLQSGTAGTAITLTNSGGNGLGLVSYVATGSNCVISNNTVNATAPTTCSVTATKSADYMYNASTFSPAVTFTFSPANQSTLTISTSNQKTIAKGTTGITLQTTGGSGTGAVTLTTITSGCVINSNRLTVDIKVTPGALVRCSVTAKKAASGIYGEKTSAPKVFNFN